MTGAFVEFWALDAIKTKKQIMVYAAIKSFQGSSETCWPSQKAIQSRLADNGLSMSIPRISIAIKALCEAGVIAKTRRGAGRSNIYRCLSKEEYESGAKITLTKEPSVYLSEVSERKSPENHEISTQTEVILAENRKSDLTPTRKSDLTTGRKSDLTPDRKSLDRKKQRKENVKKHVKSDLTPTRKSQANTEVRKIENWKISEEELPILPQKSYQPQKEVTMLYKDELWLKRFEEQARKSFALGTVLNWLEQYRGHDSKRRPVFADQMAIVHKYQLEKHPDRPIVVPEHVVEMMREAA